MNDLDLIEIVEAEFDDVGFNEDRRRFYELYEDAFHSYYDENGIRRWLRKDVWFHQNPGKVPTETRHILVTSNGGYIGHWGSVELFFTFLHEYLRPTKVVTYSQLV